MTSRGRHVRAGARRLVAGDTATAVTAPVRRCAECGERLSAYNPNPTCYAHTVGMPWKGPHHPR